jgi:hypothetical protein
MKSGQEFIFSVESPQDGYLSIFNIYPDGRVAIIKGNLALNANKKTIYPHPIEDGIVLQAATIDPEIPGMDIYIAIETKERQNLLEFSQLSNEGNFVSGETTFSAATFSRWFDNLKTKQAAVLKTRTEP